MTDDSWMAESQTPDFWTLLALGLSPVTTNRRKLVFTGVDPMLQEVTE